MTRSIQTNQTFSSTNSKLSRSKKNLDERLSYVDVNSVESNVRHLTRRDEEVAEDFIFYKSNRFSMIVDL